jgi:hypothetical protein
MNEFTYIVPHSAFKKSSNIARSGIFLKWDSYQLPKNSLILPMSFGFVNNLGFDLFLSRRRISVKVLMLSIHILSLKNVSHVLSVRKV